MYQSFDLSLLAVVAGFLLLVLLGICFDAIRRLQWQRLFNPTVISVVCVLFCFCAGIWYGFERHAREERLMNEQWAEAMRTWGRKGLRS